jgi:predicted RNA-binding protein with RPS1 domain
MTAQGQPEPDPGEPTNVRWIETAIDVGNLSNDIVDPQRTHAVVCVTVPTWASEPLVDPTPLVAAVASAATVYVLPTGDLSWELTDRLPPRLDVYGGAVRIWWPFSGAGLDPLAHPLFFIHDRRQSEATIEKIVRAFEQRGLVGSARPEAGSELPGLVTRVLGRGAELTLVGGAEAFAHATHLTRHRGLEPAQVVQVGQAVRVRVVEGSGGRRIPVTLLPFEPDPWERFAEQHREGMVVEGVVDELRNVGALVEVFPGVRGLLRKAQISRDWVSHPEDFLEESEWVAVRLVHIDSENQKVELSLLDIDPEEEVPPPAPLYPDGPPWLDLVEPAEIELSAAAEPVPSAEESADPAPAAEAAEGEREEDEQGTAAAGDDVEALERAILDGRELQRQVDGLFTGVERRIAELRAEAHQLAQMLERDLVQARLRVLEFAESETSELVGSTEEALAHARREAEELREQLTAAEADRRGLLQRLKEERERVGEATRRAERLGKELKAERERIDRGAADASRQDPEERLLDEIRGAWERTTVPAERERFPWRAPAIGPEFLDSLDEIQGIRREKVTEVCAHLVCGRAREMPALEVHRLRSSEGGGTPQRIRADGAKAWRCSLQSGTPAARRLHYWVQPGGRIELARVVYHDDFSIR